MQAESDFRLPCLNSKNILVDEGEILSNLSTVTNVMEKICIFQVVNIFICVIVDCEYESAPSTRHVKIMNFNMLNFCLQKWRESLRDKLKSTLSPPPPH